MVGGTRFSWDAGVAGIHACFQQVKEQAHQILIDWSPNTCFFLTSTQVCTARGTQHCTADIAAPGVVCRWDRASRRGGRECQIALRTPQHTML